MPVCFQLFRRTNGTSPILQEVDDQMREHFGAPASEDSWYKGWYNTIGLCMALGHDWNKLRETWPDKAEIIDWLEANFTTDAWREHKQ